MYIYALQRKNILSKKSKYLEQKRWDDGILVRKRTVTSMIMGATLLKFPCLYILFPEQVKAALVS